MLEEGLQTGLIHILTMHIENLDIRSSIVPSINTITVANPSVYVLPPVDKWFYDYLLNIYMITVFIECSKELL